MLSFKCMGKGYVIFKDGTPWIQQDDYIPYPKDTLEASAQAHIDAINRDHAEAALHAQLTELKARLESTDYQIIKCYEYQLAGLEMPYNIRQLHTDRQALRDQINVIEAQA